MKNSLPWFMFIATIILRPKRESGVRYEIVWFNLFCSLSLFAAACERLSSHCQLLENITIQPRTQASSRYPSNKRRLGTERDIEFSRQA